MRRRWLSVLICAAVLAGVCTAALGAGGADDPLISAGWLQNTLVPTLRELLDRESAGEKALAKEFETRLSAISFPERENAGTVWTMTPMELRADDSFMLDLYSCFLLLDGKTKLRCGGCEVVDVTTGQVCPDGTWLQPQHRYFAAEGVGARLLVYSDTEGFLDGSGERTSDVLFSPADRYTDTEGHWAEESICRMTELNAVNGIAKHTFAPDMQVSRAMFITVLSRLFGAEDGKNYDTVFTDVHEGDWYAPYIGWAAAKGLVLGYGDGSFGPDDRMTREQMAAVLARCCEMFDFTLPDSAGGGDFADSDTISSWAQEAVELSRRAGLLNGRTTGDFDPAGSASRAEMCAVLCRLYEKTE